MNPAYVNPSTAAAVHWVRTAPVADLAAAKAEYERRRGVTLGPVTRAELVKTPGRCAAMLGIHRAAAGEGATR